MMSRKDFPHINVVNLPNGYALTVGDNEYLAMTPESLVDIFFVHVAIGKLEYINRDMAAGLLQAAATWKTVGEALSANAQLLAETRRAERDYQAAIRGQAAANERADKALKERNFFYQENLELKLENDRLKKKLEGIGRAVVGSKPEPTEKKKYDRSDIRKSDIYPKPKTKKKGKERYARKL